MAELRYNPMLDEWVMVASHRQGRPQMPKDWCPFCPGSGNVPDSYDVLKYSNDFPALSFEPPVPDDIATELFRTEEAFGKCEVILYSPDHNAVLHELPNEHIRKLVDLWASRFGEISSNEKIKYVFIFENRGEMVGVTMPHPHGQIYGYPFVPKKIRQELESSKKHYQNTGHCLSCDILNEELREDKRIICKNDSFTAFLPFYTHFPYGVNIISNRHLGNLTEMTGNEKNDLAAILKNVTAAFDNLFGFAFPYMMCMHQTPVNGEDASEYYHFHIEFYPPMRASDKQLFIASSETGAGACCNPTSPEEKAEELRKACLIHKKDS